MSETTGLLGPCAGNVRPRQIDCGSVWLAQISPTLARKKLMHGRGNEDSPHSHRSLFSQISMRTPRSTEIDASFCFPAPGPGGQRGHLWLRLGIRSGRSGLGRVLSTPERRLAPAPGPRLALPDW